MLRAIWAQSPTGVIGANGDLCWDLPEDLRHFRRATRGATVVMGSATWQSLPPAARPLPGRRNIVLNNDPAFQAPGAEVVGSLEAALDAALGTGDDAWIIGGGSVYRQALPLCEEVQITVVDVDVPGDTFAPVLDAEQWQMVTRTPSEGWFMSEDDIAYRFERWVRRTER